MGQAEYIVRFKGDYSALESDLKKINGATKKLEDDEVIIKLNYDGNIKEFNKVFDSISKQHPELGIQFQYNVNEKLLNQELDKLEKYTQLKLDIDESNVQSKLEKMGDDIGLALQNHLDAKDIKKLVENYFGYYNTAIKAGAKHINIDEINNRLSKAFEIESKDIKQIFDDIFESGKSETLQLFKFDKSLNDDLLATKERIEDIRNVLKLLKEKGASETGLPSELQKVQDEIKILRSDIQEMQEQLKDLSGEAFTRMSENIKETNRQLDITKERLKVVQDFLKNNGNSEVLNFTEALNKLQGMLSTFYKENNGNHVSSFWDELIQKAQDGDKEVLQLLSDLRLLKNDNLPNKVNAGMVKSGGLIGDDYTVLTTKIRSDKFSGDRLKDAEELKNRLDAISNSGVNAARTLAIVSDEANNLFVEIQQTAPGKMLGQIYGQTDKDWVNMDFLKAEDEEILKLIVDLETLRKAGIGVDLNAGNLLYQKGKGFSIIDMDLKPLQDYEETISESQNVLLDSIKQFFEEQTDETGNIKAEAQEAINALDAFSNRFGVIAEEKRELIDKLSTEGANNNQILINDAATEATKEAADAIKKAQDSNSPAELTKPLGQNFTEGYAEGIREAIPEVVQACKEVVLAAYNAMKEADDSEDGETVDLSESFISGFRKNLENALPTIQEELQKILSKINVDDDAYTNVIGIGQELIDSVIVGIKNEHSAESFKETIEQVITDAFSNIVLDRATKAIVQQIQSYIDSYTSIDPFVIENFDVNTNSIVISIQDALNSNKFNINLDGTIKDLSTALNTSADNVRMSFIDAIDWMRQANEWQKLNEKDATHERGLWFNSKTGQFSNPTVVGNEHSVGFVKYYNTEEFEKEFGKGITQSINKQTNHSPTLPEDFQQQLQGSMDESGKYIIKVCGELIDNFKSELQQAINELGSYVIEIRGELTENFRSDLIHDMESYDDSFYYINIMPRLFETFKEVLQEAIDGLGAFKIEVKPYMKKGGEIEEVDLPSGNNQNNNSIYDFYKKYGTPSQAMDKGYNIDEVLQMLGGNFANKSNDIHEPILNAEFFKELIKYLDLTEDELDVIKAALIEIDRYAEGGEFRHLFDSDENADITVNNRLKRIQAIIDGEHKISELEKNNAKNILKYSNQQEANDVETTTKAYLSKKEVVEQLRTELNLTKKAAEDLFDQQGYTKTNNKYQIEQAAVEELIASLKKKQETEESTKPTQTSATATAMQEEVSVVNAAIEEEKKKFDELKNKISKTIPNAVKKKNEAFEQERDLVAKVVDDEVDYFDVLNNTINGVTNSIEKQYDVTKNAKPKLNTSDINPEETNITDSTPESRKTKTTLLSLDKIEQKIREIGLSTQDTEKAIALLGGSKQSFSWMNSELEDQYDKVNALVEIFKRLGIVISSVENSDAWDTTISTNSILDFNKQKYQSVGQKSTIQQEMAEYYTQMQKEAEDIYAKAIQKTSGLTDKIAVLKNSGKYTQDFVNELTNAEKEVENLLNALKAGEVPLEEVDTKVTELANNIENTLAKKAFNDVKLAAEKSLTNVGLKIDQIIAKNSAMGEDFKQRFMGLRKELEDAKSVQAVQKIVAEVDKLESELIQAGKTGKSFIDQIKQRLRDINSKYIAQYFSFQDIIRYAREAFSAVQELNIQMVELAKVSEQSLSQIEDDFNSYANTAKDLGATISDTISATADWARMGYNVPDAKQLAEVALLYKNVGDGIDITAANQSLISTLQGYQMQADEAEHIVDVFNEVANNYAIDTAGIGEALQRSAASLDAANTSLEQSVALVTAANTVVQNPESVGTTFKTLSARLRGAKTDLEELGEEEDEFTQTTSKLQSLVKGLTGFDILEADQKTYKSIYDILVGIGKEWKNLTDIEQASLGEALFGKRNANVGFAILNNIDTLTSAYETAENAAGSARREQENYEKGIEYSVNKAKAALQELAFDALDSDLLKGLIDMGTNAINLLDTIIDKFGLLKTAIVGIAGVIGSQKLG